MKRLFLLPALLGLVLLAGCAESKPESESPLKVDHATGETIVPARPERVVALEPDAIETSLALGVAVTSAASVKADGTLGRHLGKRGRAIPVVGKAWDIDLIKVVAAGPDVIIGSKRRQGSLWAEMEEDIAPTVLTETTGGVWKLNLRVHADAVNRPDAGEGLLRDYDLRILRLERKLGPDRFGKDVSILRVTPGGLETYTRDSFPGTILADAGLGRPPAQAVRGRGEIRRVPPERLSDVDGDLLLVSVAPGAEKGYRELTASQAWSQLRAVQSGNVRRVDDDAWITGQGILAARRVIADLGKLPL